MKHRMIVLVAICIAIGLFPGCAPEQEQSTEDVLNVEADIEALKAALEEWDVAWNSQNLEKLLSLYTEDAVRMPPNEATEVGSEAIRASVQRAFDESPSEEHSTIGDVRVSGDLGYVRGTFEAATTPEAGGEPVVENGKWITVHQRQPDGSWQIICEIWNANLPTSQ